MDIGNKLKELRVLKGLTQEELADRSELSKGIYFPAGAQSYLPLYRYSDGYSPVSGNYHRGVFFFFVSEEQIVFGTQDYFEK